MYKSINSIHHIKRLRNRNNMTISIDTEKAFDKNPVSFHDESPMRVVMEGIYCNIIKTIYDTLTTNIMIN